MIKRLRVAWRNTEMVRSTPRRIAVSTEWAARTIEEGIIDRHFRRLGLDTSGPDFDDLDGAIEVRGYVATNWRLLRTLFPPQSLGAEDVLLEYGSGKGRVAVWVASRFPLRRIVGVERDDRLTAAAVANLEHWRGPVRCRDVDFTTADATDFDVPDDVTVIYLFNPFMGCTFDQVVSKIMESHVRRPRSLRIIYLYPIMHDALINAGFTLDRHRRHAMYAWATYRIQ